MNSADSLNRTLDVLIVGVANVDLVTRVPALPRAGETAFGSLLEIAPSLVRAVHGYPLTRAKNLQLTGSSTTCPTAVFDACMW